ncbi:MAG: DUF6484 domain-containing protein [Planctomycetota bacterium]|jgi:hypothetical protein
MKRSIAEKIQEIKVVDKITGVRIGKIIRIDENGHVMVDFPGNTRGPLQSRITNSIGHKLINQAGATGQKIILIFENDDPELPIIIDIIQNSVSNLEKIGFLDSKVDEPEDVYIDGKRVSFNAKEQIVLRCGKASITLTRAGKILIRGTYLLNRSSGVNRIRGASVHIN